MCETCKDNKDFSCRCIIQDTSRIYDTLHSGINEYKEIVMQRFSTSNNHQELGNNLSSLHTLGLSPYLTFSDDPLRDESLLKNFFPNSKNRDINDIIEDEENPPPLIEMTSNKNLYLFRQQDALDTLPQFRCDIEEASSSGVNNCVKICFDTEWPVYFERNGNNRRKTNGNINIVQRVSHVTSYTVILDLYNFNHNDHLMRSIAQNLDAISPLKVKCFIGCRQKDDYMMLQNQCAHFNFPQEIYQLMIDVSIMAINRVITKRDEGKAT